MLRTRILTAMVALPLVVAGILVLPTWAVALIAGAMLLVGAFEWVALVAPGSWLTAALFVCATALAMILLWHFVGTGLWLVLLLLAACAWWAAAIALVVIFPRGWAATVGHRAVGVMLGWLVLGTAFVALVRLHGHRDGPQLMLSLFVLIWVCDSGAYFVGRRYGRHKLAPRVSPGKTREGAAGGVVLALVAAALLGWLLGLGTATLAGFVVLGGLTAAVSIVGDLAVSMFKRQAGSKDSGGLFPGHGGVLDRLDSMLAAAPVFVAGLIWWIP
ncbi:MAG: phosphatidate cytidylyltransferase [Salinisphaera sp.]|nr:phosphatidate cytidylyltransferase [Salinisphaera sp.]